MAVLGVNFNKIHLDKFSAVKGKVSVRNNVLLTNCEKTDFSVGTNNQPMMKVGFEFTVDYEPKIANISLAGELLYLDTADKIDEYIKQWTKEKKLPKDMMSAFLTHIIQKANIEALLLSREIGLPAPIRLPTVNVK